MFSAQEIIDHAEPNGSISLGGGDYAPLIISQPLTLNANGATFYALPGSPAMDIRAADVSLQNMLLRSQQPPSHQFEQPLVLRCNLNCEPTLQNVGICGRVEGMPGESNLWLLPAQLNLGDISANQSFFLLELGVPVKCRLRCAVAGIDFDTPALSPGINVVRLRVRDVLSESLLIGNLEIISSQLTRLIPLFGRAARISSSTCTTVHLCQLSDEQRYEFLALRTPSPLTSAPKCETAFPPKQSWLELPVTLELSASLQSANSQPVAAIETSNYFHQPRLPFYLLINCSGTMVGEPIEAINNGIRSLHADLMGEPSAIESTYLSVIAFDSGAHQVFTLTEISKFTAPDLQASGTRSLGAALELLLQCIDREVRKPITASQGDFKPWVLILTGGNPTDSWQKPADEIKRRQVANQMTVMAVPCGNDLDSRVLDRITDTVVPPNGLSPDAFRDFFVFNLYARE